MPVSHYTKSASRTMMAFGSALLVLAILALPTAIASAQSTPPKVSRKEAKAQAKAAKDEKKAELEAKGERVNAKDERKALLKQIALTKAQKASVDEIEKRYDPQMKDLNTQLKTSEKAGPADPRLVAKADALMLLERTDLRAVLSGEQVAQFDRNAKALGARK